MKTKTFTLKSSTSIAIALSLTLLAACQKETSTTDPVNEPDTVATDTSSSDSNSINTDTVILNSDKANQNQQETPLQSSEFAEFKAALQGSWKRVDYPFGTVEFDKNQVKFTAGEGAVEPAVFEDFKISDECPDNIDADASALAYDFLVVDGKRCNPIRLNDNKLSLTFVGADKATEYERMDKPTATASALKSIPNNFLGNWAVGSKNCNTKKAEQMQITADKLSFSKSEAQLAKVKQFEPTRLEADFDYLENGAKTDSYFYTLDLQNNSQELIVRENGAAPMKYHNCQ